VGLFALLLAVSRTFGPEATGVYAVGVSVGGFAAMASDVGLQRLTLKELAGRFAADLPSQILCLRLALATVLFAAVAGGVALSGVSPESAAVVLTVTAAFVLRSQAEGVGAMLLARDAAHLAAGLEVVFRLTGALAATAAVLAGAPLAAALLPLPLAEGSRAALGLVLAHRRVAPLAVAVDARALLRLLRRALPFSLSPLLGHATPRAAVLLVAVLLGSAAAGYYHAAFRFVFVLVLVPQMLGQALLPAAARAFARGRAEAARLYEASLDAVLLATVPAAVGLFWVAPPLVELVLGSDFAPAVAPLRVLAPLAVLMSASLVTGTFLLAGDRVAERARWDARAAVVGLGLTAALVPGFGLLGAAAAAAAGQLLLVAGLVCALRPLLGWPRSGRRVAIAVAGAGVFSAAFALLPPLPLLASAALGAGLYVATLLLFREIRVHEARLLAEWWRVLWGRA